jgi:predicted Zn-dependent protease
MSEQTELINGLIDVPQHEVGLLMEAGYLFLELGAPKKALDVFQGVAALVPTNEIPMIALGHLAFSQGKFEQALKYNEDALKRNPNSTLAKAHKGESLMFMGKHQEAMAILKSVLSEDTSGVTRGFVQALIDAFNDGAFSDE